MAKKKIKKCEVCLGTGSILVQIGKSENDFVENECDACGGTGEQDE